MSDDLTALENWVQPLLDQLTPAARRRLLRQLAVQLRAGQQARIDRQQNPDGTPFEPRKERSTRKRGRIRRQAKMFRKLRQARHLKIRTTASQVAVGYSGKTARIALVHQEGKLDRVSPGGPLYQYARRILLGFTADDRDAITETALSHLLDER
ncbi:phage virion morphogenesis protein [Sedimenticola hydrogenitrophicus]|uniref:phage virion morphogenesis protein n=1 Tax=Sedimenticola hydrogenitrophicus TaxID=2967975 RepID=UPI0023B0BA7B|nr:phage virion morphogenesis protein [Sedimenticola hydrogenitrophicus]